MRIIIHSLILVLVILTAAVVGTLVFVKCSGKEPEGRSPSPAPIGKKKESGEKISPPKKKLDIQEETVAPYREVLRADQAITVGRIGKGIIRAKTKNGWWECGELHTDKDTIERMAVTMAYNIVLVADYVSEKRGDVGTWELNPWAFAALIYNESGMDRCALGRNPRKFAYTKGLLVRNKRTISHPMKDIITALKDTRMKEAFKVTGVDIGLTQLLSRFFSDPTDYVAMMSLEGGLERAAWELEKRHRIYRTDRPWRWWRGSEVGWYDDKLVRWSRYLGAKEKDLRYFIAH